MGHREQASILIYSIDIRKYIDFTAGIAVVALGHADPTLAQIMYDQALELTHCSNLYHSPWPGELAKLIIETTKSHSPETPFQKVFIANSGTESNEAALKFARKVGKQRGGDNKIGIVCFERGFHGRTFGALSVTPQPKYQKPFSPMVPGVKIGVLNDIAALEKLVDEETCGVIVEPIQGEGGVYEASEEFLTALRKRCNKVGAVLIYDEIQVLSLNFEINNSVVCLGQESYGLITTFRRQLPLISLLWPNLLLMDFLSVQLWSPRLSPMKSKSVIMVIDPYHETNLRDNVWRKSTCHAPCTSCFQSSFIPRNAHTDSINLIYIPISNQQIGRNLIQSRRIRTW